MRTITSFVLATWLVAAPASASHIGVFFTSDASDCDMTIPQGTPFTIYIIAILSGDAAAAGITGAEYRLVGNDPGWFANYTPGPGSNLALGSPIDGTGANVAWPSCQMPATGLVLLGTISGFSPVPPTERILQIGCRNPPNNVNFPCPLVSLCDQSFSLLCVPGAVAFVNRFIPCQGEILTAVCPVIAIEPRTWSRVKRLYTN